MADPNPNVFKSQDMIKGEVRVKAIEVTSTTSFTIASGTYQIFDANEAALTEVISATVSGGIISGIVDTTTFQKGKIHIDYTLYSGSEKIMSRLTLNII